MTRKRLYYTEEEKIAGKKASAKRWMEKSGVKEEKYKKDKENAKARFRAWQKRNPEKLRLKSAMERAAKLQRIPQWADLKAISDFYLECPIGYHVDHIIPLRGKNVSGLHLRENLQYLTSDENLKKGNSFQC